MISLIKGKNLLMSLNIHNDVMEAKYSYKLRNDFGETKF